MEQLKKALDYFIDYEWVHRLENITLNGKRYINITWEESKNVSLLRKRLNHSKLETVKRVIENICFVDYPRKKEVIKELERLYAVTDMNNVHIEQILFQEDYQYRDNYLKDVRIIQNILQDNQIRVLYPVLANGKNKIPFVCFEMELLKDSFRVEKYHLQIEALRVMIAAILGCEIPEVEIVVKDFREFYQSLTALKSRDFFDIIHLIDEELKGKFFEYGFESIWTYKEFNHWAVTEEIVLTMETFEDMLFPLFLDEIKAVRRQCEVKTPAILKKYLFGNSQSQSSECVKPVFWDGSYTAEYAINEKQMRVVSAYQNTQLLSVNGPPGTGKTTVLKEIIANNIVKKTKDLLGAWDTPWRSIGSGKQQVYISPFHGTCNYSMVVTSTNNKAVDNIGIDLLKEVDYFSEIASEHGYKGILCARLGKIKNLDRFRDEALNPLIEFLGEAVYDEKEAKKCIAEFRKIEMELGRYEDINCTYLQKRDQVCK